MSEILKTIAVDISHSVFDNDTAAMMYITKDIYADAYIISIPIITFSFDLREEKIEDEYTWLQKSVPIGDPVRKEKLVAAIKQAIIDLG